MAQPGGRRPAPPPLDLVQDFVNTIDIEMDRDTMTSRSALRRFCTGHGINGIAFDESDVEEVRVLREALRDACAAHAGRTLPRTSSTLLRKYFRPAVLTVDLSSRGEATLVPNPELGGCEAFAAHLALAIATASVAGSWLRLKACHATDCRWVYYDHGPAGTSRWCTMKICGSRNKMRAYRSRRP